MKGSGKRAFTLIELLGVIAVVGILSAVLLPAIGTVLWGARRARDGSHLRQLATAYLGWRSGLPGVEPRVENLYEWARMLAENGGMNEPGVYIFMHDPLVRAKGCARPKAVAHPAGSTGAGWTLDPEFRACPLSVVVVTGIPVGAPRTTTPLAWTRGLTRAGRWRPETDRVPGVYGEKGGHIVFLDGHVEFFGNLKEEGGLLVDYRSRRPTADIAAALPPGARALRFDGPAF